MRKNVSVLLVTAAVITASLAWLGFVGLNTFLDPDRGDKVVSAVLDNDAVRDTLADQIAAGVGPSLNGVATPDQIHAAALAALDDPQLKNVLVGTIVAYHKQMLGGPKADPIINATAVAAATRDALARQNPQLANQLPAVPPVPITSPVTSVPNLLGLRNFLQAVVPVLAALAVVLFVAAFMLSTDRAWVMRRLGWWALATGLFFFILGIVLPRGVGAVAPGAKVSTSAIISALFGGVIPAAVGLVILGGSAVGVSYLLNATATPTGGPPTPPTPPPAPRKSNSYERQIRTPQGHSNRGTSPGRRW